MLTCFSRSYVILPLILVHALFPISDTPQETVGLSAGTDEQAYNAAIENALTSFVIEQLEEAWKSPDLSTFKPIIERASAYVREFQVFERTLEEENTCVRVSAILDSPKLLKDMAMLALRKMRTKPRIVIATYGQRQQDESLSLYAGSALEQELTRFFEEKGFEIITGDLLKRLYGTEKLVARLSENEESQVRIAEENLANAIVLARVNGVSEPTTPGSNILRNSLKLWLVIQSTGNQKEKQELTAEAVVNSKEIEEGLEQAELDAFEKIKNDALVATILLVSRAEYEPRVIIEANLDTSETVSAAFLEKVRAFSELGRAEIILQNSEILRIVVFTKRPIGDLVSLLTTEEFGGVQFYAKSVVNNTIILSPKN